MMFWTNEVTSKQANRKYQARLTQQVLAACRVGDQSVIDASVDSLLPGMAPVGDVDGATKCIHDQLADVTEALCPPKSEGDHPAQRRHADCLRHYNSEGTCIEMPKTSV